MTSVLSNVKCRIHTIHNNVVHAQLTALAMPLLFNAIEEDQNRSIFIESGY